LVITLDNAGIKKGEQIKITGNQYRIIDYDPNLETLTKVDIDKIELLEPPYHPNDSKFKSWLKEIQNQGYILLDIRIAEYFIEGRIKSIPKAWETTKYILFPGMILCFCPYCLHKNRHVKDYGLMSFIKDDITEKKHWICRFSQFFRDATFSNKGYFSIAVIKK